MGIFDKVLGRDDDRRDDKAKPDFSDVRASSPNVTRAPRPAADATTPRPDFSDVQGASSSQSVEREKQYTVAAGDSLSKIAQREYGDAAKWQRIYEANRATVTNPNLIHPGQVLTLPADV